MSSFSRDIVILPIPNECSLNVLLAQERYSKGYWLQYWFGVLFVHAQNIQNRVSVTLLSLEMGSTAGLAEANRKCYGLACAKRRGQKIAHVMPFSAS